MRLGSRIAVAVVCRPTAAAAVQPLVWELPHAAGAALKIQNKKKKKKKKGKRRKVVRINMKIVNKVHLSSRDMHTHIPIFLTISTERKLYLLFNPATF